jgi:cysteinyl-tRNA synthetase
VVAVNELVSSADVADAQKYALLVSWDQVLGLDLQREAASSWEPTDEIKALVAQRDAARGAKDYGESDRIRGRLSEMGLEVMDTSEGTKVRPRRPLE